VARALPDRQRAWDYLLNVLSRQAYTAAELRTKLTRRQVDDALVEELLARLVELRLVDDVSYAEQYVAARQGARGRLALRAELRRKGVAEVIVDDRVGRLGEEQQLQAALGLLRKHAWRYRPKEGESVGAEGERAEGERRGIGAAGVETAGVETVDVGAIADPEYEARQRLRRSEAKAKSFLARRGFAPDVVVAAVERLGWFR